jgi:hypothetical protein
MAISIDKRIRALTTDPWGAWTATTDAPPYTDTDLVEYRIDSGSTKIDMTDITDNVVIGTDSSGYVVTGDGYFDDLMETVNKHLDVQYRSSRLTGSMYAQAYVGLVQAAMTQSVAFALSKRRSELQADKVANEVAISDIAVEVSGETKEDKINVSGYKAEVEGITRDIASGTKNNKISLVGQQLAKLVADTEYVIQQDAQLVQSVADNKLIKAIDTLGDTYGTFGAGGITVNADMWGTYYDLIYALTNTSTGIIDTSTISKVS